MWSIRVAGLLFLTAVGFAYLGAPATVPIQSKAIVSLEDMVLDSGVEVRVFNDLDYEEAHIQVTFSREFLKAESRSQSRVLLGFMADYDNKTHAMYKSKPSSATVDLKLRELFPLVIPQTGMHKLDVDFYIMGRGIKINKPFSIWFSPILPQTTKRINYL